MSEEERKQAEVVDFLSDPATYAEGVEEVAIRATHAARVFLAGARAYKMKRAVKFTFLDFTTLERRHAALEAELRLNRRWAPQIYLRLLPVARREGRLALGPPGEVLEWLLEMRRFEERLLLTRLAEEGRLTESLARDLADVVLALHEGAERRGPPYGGSAAIAALVEENAANLAELAPFVPVESGAALAAASRSACLALSPLLDRRRTEGWVRRCHGDLHLANIVLWEGRPTPFDGLEFSEELATIDVAYDLAFLLMDLEVRGLGPSANLVMSRYLGRGGGLEVLAALPLFMSLRATIRGKIAGFRARETTGEAREEGFKRMTRLLSAAEAFLRPEPPVLLAVGGLSGSGKSTLARRLAPRLGRRPGALHLASDLLRKRLFGLAPESPLPPEAYRPEVNRRLYESLFAEAEQALSAGQAVVLDAVFARPEERGPARSLAERRGVPFVGLWLDAPAESLLERVRARRGDLSDADEAVVRRQLDYELGEITWRRLQAELPPDALAERASDLLHASLATRSR